MIHPLKQKLKEFADGATAGLILFSLGSVVQNGTLPASVTNTFLNVFSKLKPLRVIWKWSGGSPPQRIPLHVHLSTDWLPQQDVLGHPNTKLFISHGGLLSLFESAFHAVPVLGIPLFGDHDLNLARAVSMGYARVIELLDLTAHVLEHEIHSMFNMSAEYSAKAREMSAVLRRRPVTPLALALDSIDQVLRNEGKPKYLQSGAKQLSALQYHCVDVVFAVALLLGAILQLLIKLVSRIAGSGRAQYQK